MDDAIAAGIDWQRQPLTGLPVLFKDNTPIAGMKMTNGDINEKNTVPTADAPAVKSWRAAGTIIFGQTNMPEWGGADETDNNVYGRTNNPYDLSRSSGGSSGGMAAALAAGLAPLGMGNDGGGSIREPSAWSGVVGLKETWRRTPVTGSLGGGIIQNYLAVHGPMARFVRDLALGHAIMAEADGLDPYAVPMPINDYRKVRVADLRIAFFTDNGIHPPTPEIRDTVAKCAAALADAKARVNEVRPPRISESHDLFCSLFAADNRAYLLLDESRGYKLEQHSKLAQKAFAVYDEFDQKHRCSDPANRVKNYLWWGDYQLAINTFFKEWDAIVSPVNAFPAMPHRTGFDHHTAFSYARPGNLLGVPAAVVRCGTSPEGLPIGVQIFAPKWREDISLAVADYLEQCFGGWQLSPLFHGPESRATRP